MSWWSCFQFWSGDDFFDYVAEDVGQAAGAAFEVVSQSLVVEAQQCEHGGVEVVDMNFSFGGSEAEFVCGSDGLPALHAAASHPDAEAVRAVVSAV